MQDQNRRHAAHRARKKDRGARHARHSTLSEAGEKIGHRSRRLLEASGDGGGATVPNKHHAIDASGEQQRDVTTIRDFQRIRGEEAGVDGYEQPSKSEAQPQVPMPNFAQRNE